MTSSALGGNNQYQQNESLVVYVKFPSEKVMAATGSHLCKNAWIAYVYLL